MEIIDFVLITGLALSIGAIIFILWAVRGSKGPGKRWLIKYPGERKTYER